MSKEWKCGDCCCFQTDSCLFGEMDENSSACSETVVDHDKAYRQGKADAIEEIFDSAYDIDMDSSVIYLKFDRENYDIPYMTKKAELFEWFKKQLKEKK